MPRPFAVRGRAAMEKERRQRRDLVELLAVELSGATCGEHGTLVAGFDLLITLGGAFAFCGYHHQEERGELR